MSVKIHVIRPEIINDVWGVVWPLLEPSLDGDVLNDEQSIKLKLMSDSAILLNATVDGKIKGAVVLTIETQKHKIAYVAHLGGSEFSKWGDAMNTALSRIAQEMGCKYVMGHGTKAWSKILKDFKPGKILFCKEVA